MNGKPPYVINLDPAVLDVPFPSNIDIRDTIKYKEVMKEYNLGPNGAILTCLNLFMTKFDRVLEILQKRSESGQLSHILVDTPGQIEIFTWSASGTIITETLAALMPTVIAYIIDTPRCTSPTTFMANMLYACRTQLPFVLVFNKTDIKSHEFVIKWMTDFESFQEALLEDEESYMTSMVHSMSLVLDEFYQQLRVSGVSSLTGEGFDSFFAALRDATIEYETNYRPEFEKKLMERKAAESAAGTERLGKLAEDLEVKEQKHSLEEQ